MSQLVVCIKVVGDVLYFKHGVGMFFREGEVLIIRAFTNYIMLFWPSLTYASSHLVSPSLWGREEEEAVCTPLLGVKAVPIIYSCTTCSYKLPSWSAHLLIPWVWDLGRHSWCPSSSVWLSWLATPMCFLQSSMPLSVCSGVAGQSSSPLCLREPLPSPSSSPVPKVCPPPSSLLVSYQWILSYSAENTIPHGHQFMINLLVSSLMVDRGLENALVTAIAYEVQDPSAVLKPGVESTVPLLALVQQMITTSTAQCSAFIKEVRVLAS